MSYILHGIIMPDYIELVAELEIFDFVVYIDSVLVHI